MVSAPGWALAALMASRSDSLPSSATVSRGVVTRKVAGTARPSRHSSPGTKRRRRRRSAALGGVPRKEDRRARSFFNMTRSTMLNRKVGCSCSGASLIGVLRRSGSPLLHATPRRQTRQERCAFLRHRRRIGRSRSGILVFGLSPRLRGQFQISDVESPFGKRISWARAGPSGSLPKSTWKRSLRVMPPFRVSQSICRRYEPSLAISG